MKNYRAVPAHAERQGLDVTEPDVWPRHVPAATLVKHLEETQRIESDGGEGKEHSMRGGNSMRRFLAVLAAFAAFSAGAAAAAGPDDILGVWDNEEKDAQIELYRCGERYCGRIVWLQAPNYQEGSTDGTPGTPKVDHNNPDPALRKNPVIGLDIVKDFRYDRENRWTDGTVYDPKNGKTYKGKMTLGDDGRLDLRGYIGISLFGRTTSWTRPGPGGEAMQRR